MLLQKKCIGSFVLKNLTEVVLVVLYTRSTIENVEFEVKTVYYIKSLDSPSDPAGHDESL